MADGLSVLAARLKARLHGVQIATPEAFAVGDCIARHRRAMGLTQAKAAEKARVPASTIANAEQGCRVPNPATMAKIVQALDIPLDALTRAIEQS